MHSSNRQCSPLSDPIHQAGQHTIAIDGTMGTRLFPIAFDLLATTLIAGSSHPSSLLQLFRVRYGGGTRIRRKFMVVIVIKMSIVVVVSKTDLTVAGKRTWTSHGECGVGQEASWK